MSDPIHTAEDTIRLSITEAIGRFGKSNTTIYTWIKKHGWRHENDDNGKAFVWIPKDYLEKYGVNQDEAGDKGLPKDSQVLEQVVKILENNYEERLRTQEELIKAKDELLQSKRSEVEALNHQLSNVQNQLMTMRDVDRHRKWSLFERIKRVLTGPSS